MPVGANASEGLTLVIVLDFLLKSLGLVDVLLLHQ
jgi:hypothetical protein